MLLDAGLPIEEFSLKKALECGNLEITKLLLEKGAEISDITEEYKKYFLNCSIDRNDNLEMIKFLIDCGGKSPEAIESAARSGNQEAIQLLLDEGVKPSLDAVVIAIEEDHLEIASFLIKNGAEVTDDTEVLKYKVLSPDDLEMVREKIKKLIAC